MGLTHPGIKATGMAEFLRFQDDEDEGDFLQGSPSLSDTILDLVHVSLWGSQKDLHKELYRFANTYSGPNPRYVKSEIQQNLKRAKQEKNLKRKVDAAPVDEKSRQSLIDEMPWSTEPCLLSENNKKALDRFIKEIQSIDILRKHNIPIRPNMLLNGPPGTGKTLIANHIAARLGRPFHVVRLDAIISSLLGSTTKNIRAVVEYASRSSGFLFFDEFDAIAKARDDNREIGEIKRVVNALLQSLDRIEGDTVIVAATNHSHLLDPAVWRRFPYHCEISLPDYTMRLELWQAFMDISRPQASALAKVSDGLSGSDLKEIANSEKRLAVLEERTLNSYCIVRALRSSTNGKVRFTDSPIFERGEKTELRKFMREKGVTVDEMAKTLGISRGAAQKGL
jgi:SpoVK/Ycf46/Vps4 family AAA+-type ATPase